jgi:preprotein translocase subunit SecF
VTQVIDNAITRTMSRTIITHGCTQLMVTSMLFFGGEALHYFALALTIGIIFGIYSSVLVACPVAMWLGMSRDDFVHVEKKPETVEEGA